MGLWCRLFKLTPCSSGKGLIWLMSVIVLTGIFAAMQFDAG